MNLLLKLLPAIISGIISIVFGNNLRNQLYKVKNEHEIMWIALDDVARMHPEHPSGIYAKKVLSKIPDNYRK